MAMSAAFILKHSALSNASHDHPTRAHIPCTGRYCSAPYAGRLPHFRRAPQYRAATPDVADALLNTFDAIDGAADEKIERLLAIENAARGQR